MKGNRGAVLLNVIAFMVIGLMLITSYFLRSYYQAQRSQNEIERTSARYVLEGDLQRAIALVKSSGRKDLTSTVSFPNQNMWVTSGLVIEIKEFSNWDGYVINGTEALNEVNGADPVISDDYAVSIKIKETGHRIELEYIIPAPAGGEAFTIYAHEDLILDSNANWYPYFDSSESWRWYDYYYGLYNDVRVENANVMYSQNLIGNISYKFGTGSAPEQETLDLPFYLEGTQGEFNTWLQSLVDNGTVMPEGDYYSNLSVTNLRNYHWRWRPWNRSNQFNVIAVFGNLTINADYSYITNPISKDILFIVTGNVTMRGQYWFEGNGRLGVICYNNIHIDSDSNMIGGNMYLIGNSMIIESSYDGNISILGKLLSGGDMTLYGDDYDPSYYENTGTDFSQPKDLRGTALQDNVNIFDNPRAITVDLDLPAGGGGVTGNAIWR